MVVGLGSESTNWEHFVIVSSFKEGRWLGRLFFNLGPSLMQSTWRRGKAFSSLSATLGIHSHHCGILSKVKLSSDLNAMLVEVQFP
jgi:hypothetical protein